MSDDEGVNDTACGIDVLDGIEDGEGAKVGRATRDINGELVGDVSGLTGAEATEFCFRAERSGAGGSG